MNKKKFPKKLVPAPLQYAVVMHPDMYAAITAPFVRKVPHEREKWIVRNADGSVRYESVWLKDCTRDIMPFEVDNVVDINYAADDAFDAVEEDDHLVSYEYLAWVTTLKTDTRHESYRDCYAISNGIRAWIGRIEHICEIES